MLFLLIFFIVICTGQLLIYNMQMLSPVTRSLLHFGETIYFQKIFVESLRDCSVLACKMLMC